MSESEKNPEPWNSGALSMVQTFNLLYEAAEAAARLAAFQTNNINRKRERERKGRNQRWKCTKETLECNFAALQVEAKYCHAEIQILLHLALQGTTDDGYQHIGCSKYSCWLCWNFLAAFSQLRTRGCHDKLYHNWTIPEIDPLNTQYVIHIVNALIQVQARLRYSLFEESEQHTNAKAESSARTTTYLEESILPSRPKNPLISRYVVFRVR
jgi:hypothetical protein